MKTTEKSSEDQILPDELTDLPNESLISQLLKDREALLDLSARNRLLNTPLQKTKGVRVVDTAPTEVFQNLVEREKKVRFKPLGEEADPDRSSRQGSSLFPDASDDISFNFSEVPEELPVRLNNDQLEKKLLKLLYEARTYEEEQGVNILYLAIGFLKWYDVDHSDRPRFAPLVLVPVKLDRSTVHSKFRLSWTEEDVVTNLTLKVKLKSEFGLTLPEIDETEDFDIRDYLDQVHEIIAEKENWEVRTDDILLSFFSFAKYLMYRDLDPENWPKDDQLHQHPLIGALLKTGFRSEPPICGENDPVDSVIPPSEMIHVMDADSSQSLVIEEVRRGRNLVVQGPPGTGKSQTIANIIAASVAGGRTVLFVSEKMAALEVVKSRLEKVGLGDICLELHSHNTQKKKVLANLASTLDLGPPKQSDLTEHFEELEETRTRLNRHAELIFTPITPAGVTPYHVIGQLCRLRALGTPPSDLLGREVLTWSSSEYRKYKNQLSDLADRLKVIGDPRRNLWRGVNLDTPPFPTDLAKYKSSIDSLLPQINQVLDATEKIKYSLGIDQKLTFSTVDKLILATELLLKAPRMDTVAASHKVWEQHVDEVCRLVESGQEVEQSRSLLAKTFADVAWTTELKRVRRDLAAHGRSWLRIFKKSYRSALDTYRGIVVSEIPARHHERVQALDQLIKTQRQLKQIENDPGTQKLGERAFGTFWHAADSEWDQLNEIASWIKQGIELNSGMDLRRLLGELTKDSLDEKEIRATSDQLKPLDAEVDQFLTSLRLNCQQAFGTPKLMRVPLRELKTRLEAWRNGFDELSTWIRYVIRMRQLEDVGLKSVVEAVEAGEILPSDLINQFDFSYFENLLRGIFETTPELKQFDGEEYQRILEKFRQLDEERISLAKQQVASAHHSRIPRDAGEIGEVGVIRQEMAKKRKHRPIRKLLEDAGQVIQAIKPVFMMSPISIAQFLDPASSRFDLLVIDEASQVKPVDALGAIARCRQIVVVGDDKQLPPTGFFDKLVAPDEEDEESFQTSDVESILGLCEAQNMPMRMLEWHYRSRHHSLISVSNREFYKDRLFVVPHPSMHGNDGLIFHHVENGVYERGGNRTNHIEAREVAKAVVLHATERPGLSLGVGTFSVAQRDAILNELELLRREHPESEEFFSIGKQEPFFVKNLENIQGDERDVILISVGYGKDRNGYSTMSFGPLNGDGGERRLNVLITRSRVRCEVFSSITSDDIDLARTKSEGVRILKVFLKYAQDGHMDVGVRTTDQFDSAFEEEVSRAITEQGYEVHSQVGVAKFRIDLAVVDPNTPGRYLVGVECDGAAYHSSRSARDRDRLRQAVLEDRGWMIHRIWSTDWFHRPEQELKKVLRAIELAISQQLTTATESIAARNASEPAEGISQIERETETDKSGSSTGVPEYVEADFQTNQVISWAGNDIQRVPTQELAKVVLEVIRIEGPVHTDEVARRVTSIWGLKRTGKRIIESVSESTNYLIHQQKVTQEGEFVSLVGQAEIPVRSRENVSSPNLRKPEYLPPSEIRVAIVLLVRTHFGAHQDEVVTETARMLGFKATSQQLRELITGQIEFLVDDGVLTVNDDLKLTVH